MNTDSAHQDEYHDAMQKILDVVWGEGFMAPGGEGNVDQMVGDLDIAGKRVLDYGCGAGGPAFVLAGKYQADVTGIDIEAPLIERANQRAVELGLDEKTEFLHVQPGPLEFPDSTFDVVLSSGAFTQIENKLDTFRECLRVLRPGGVFTCYDWMKSEGEYSADMLRWFELEGLTFAMETPQRHLELFREAGFRDVTVNDRSDWYKRKVREEYELIKGAYYEGLVESIGQADTDHFVRDWHAMLVVCEKGEMLQAYCRAYKPV